ncbi:hypothetical protein JCM18899A_43810 [Nocardioides sp. AN3]
MSNANLPVFEAQMAAFGEMDVLLTLNAGAVARVQPVCDTRWRSGTGVATNSSVWFWWISIWLVVSQVRE